MKQFFKGMLLSAMLLYILPAKAQVLGNEWIDFSNTYFKFKVGKNGLYRISKSQLDVLGMGAVEGSKFAIFREGQEIPVYVSNNGVLGSDDFIEFYGRTADGKIDTELYTNASYQPTDRYNLISDTAFYFITYSDAVHQRVSDQVNEIPATPPTAEPYFWFESSPTRPLGFVAGTSYSAEYEYPSATYDEGEGFVYSLRGAGGANYNVNVATPSRVATGNSILQVSLVGNSRTSSHNTNVYINGTAVFDTTYTKYQVIKKSIPFASTLITSASTQIRFTDPQRYGVGFISIKYPRSNNVSALLPLNTNMALNAASGKQYLAFTAVTSTNPVFLYDLTNGTRYLGQKTGTELRYYVEPSLAERQVFLCDSSSIVWLNTFTPVSFIDHSADAGQGNYVILTNDYYAQNSTNYVNDYRAYRASATGGGYSAVVVSVDELYDQYGYGFEYHPSAIKRFLKYAYENWAKKPEYLLVIGKGVHYYRYRTYQANPSAYEFGRPVPTWGDPGTDNLFTDFNNDNVPEMAVGRVSVWNNDEIGNYLEKVKVYEAAIKQDANPTVENSLWKKKALHIAGGRDVALQSTQLLPALKTSANIFTDTLTGGTVTTIAKNTTDPTASVGGGIDSAMNAGLGHITFFGHAAATSFDYNLNNPDGYNSRPRFPIFYAFGCDVSQIFAFNLTIGEDYLRSANGGSIAMVSSANLSYVNVLRQYYMPGIYRQFSYLNYGKTLGKQYQANIAALPSTQSVNIHKQCIIIQGDPALSMYQPEYADYAVEEAGLSSSPPAVTTTLDSFDFKAILYNLSKATNDTVLVVLEHTKPGGSAILFTDSVRRVIKFSDTVSFRIPVNRVTDVGLNNYTIKLNPDNSLEEMSLSNNQATLQLFIADNSLVPLYPSEFAIVNKQGVTLKASALNAFRTSAGYKMEIDTTTSFDSPLKQSFETTGMGGVIKWTPALTLRDSTVYYWRATVDELIEGQYQWAVSSFIYLADASEGWNQSHYYQFKRDEPYYGLQLNAATRKFRFAPTTNRLFVSNRVYYNANADPGNIRVVLNDVNLGSTGCNLTGTIQFSVFDSATGLPWANPPLGVAGSMRQCDGKNLYQFEFPYGSAESRNNAAKFLDSIPDKNIIVIKNYTNVGPPNAWTRRTVEQWAGDADLYGEENTLYYKLKALGFSLIDSFTSNRTFIFIRKKGVESAAYPIIQTMSMDSLDIIRENYSFESFPDTGTVRSTIIGPALQWDTLRWRTTMAAGDTPFVQVYGINNLSEETLMYEGMARDTALSFISAATYPNLRLVWNSVDNINRTSANLDYWRILYKPVPEAALNPLAAYSFTDSLAEGQTAKLKLAIENLTPQDMDSMLVRYRLIDANNVTHSLGDKKYRKLPGNDTLMAELEFDPTAYKGASTLFIEANPDKNQPEQYHPNNLGYINMYLEADELNPLLDVTFDGVHILDKDIVSAKPFIKALLRDENTYSALGDTSMMTLSLTYPDLRKEAIPFDGTTCSFIPANLSDGKKNEARIEFKPNLLEDGVYSLEVSGKDKAGNLAGKAPTYRIDFTVENKPSITNLLNYPNPFSTSTAFLFTLTGSEIPSQFKIQILTVTGKIVREITKDQLGPLRIGRNITEYKWDGTDEFGQVLGNGVYLYRVVTSIRGNNVEHRANAAVDKYFKNGFGKLYIMR